MENSRVRRRLLAALCVAAAFTLATADTPPGEEQAKTAALQFGRALTSAEATSLRPLLPEAGRVRLRLVRLGPEEGTYSAEQVETLFKDFLRQGAVRSFDLLRLQCSGAQFALVHGRARVIDREGRLADVDLHITFQPEGERWIVREIREASP